MAQCYRVGQFIIGKKLGEGVCGKCYLAFHETTGVKVAIKIIDKSTVTQHPEMKRKIEREIAFLKIVNHQNVMKLYTVYETSKYLFLVMELMEGGELFDYIADKGYLPVDEVFNFFNQIINAVEHFHSRQICHCDLKPENMLLSKDKKILKIADFGMSAYNGYNKLREGCGSPHYAAPEVSMKKTYDGCIADIWSCGVVLYVMAFGLMPFDGDTLDEILAKVQKGVFEFPSEPVVPDSLRELISRLMTIDPTKRITIPEIRQSTFFKSFKAETYEIPPIVDEAGEPITKVDPNILTTLCYLLNNVHIVEIRESLTKKEPNTIRAFYRLLEQHRKNSEEDPFTFSRSSPGPQSLKNTIFAVPGSSPSTQSFSPAFTELSNSKKQRASIQHVKTPKGGLGVVPIQIANEDIGMSASLRSPLMFSMPKQAEWGLVGNHDVQTSEEVELYCSAQMAKEKMVKACNELGIVKKENEKGDFECEYKYMDVSDTNVLFEVTVKEKDIDDTSFGFGEMTTVVFKFEKGDIMSFSDVYNLITKLITDPDY
ncbi:BR serine/threonine protein kinase, putative [Entamoeba invadens IP1]|uniref:non-specific serine/threonine protein kinase n=1 Tax=Entamoeba invadens IP1 TaxID=370355 RepID=A0A0A1TY72_ENTIV|nr:BR serine/threonine protein kinase, putative [Entamoeba invadens IP1]ELP86467.1 BR serine/threonine protein kinase, putative [Entamoeba invadens IP1]|eukprot:XP_004185813.1 BR serine/threonine protein kinase, putative [Entamoeba invadens IP1]